AGLDGGELIATLLVRYHAAGAGEVGIEGSIMLVDLVPVAAGGIALPNLDQAVGHGTAALVEHAPRHDDALPLRLAGMLAGEVRLLRSDVGMAVEGAGDLRQGLRNDDQRL